MRTINAFGIDFYNGYLSEAIKDTFVYLESGVDSRRLIFTPNPEMLVEASRNQEFHSILKSAWMSLPDGTGLFWAIRLALKMKLKSRITGVDFFKKFLNNNTEHKFKVFLLGGKPGVAEKVVEKFHESHIVGVSSASSDDKSVIHEINESGAEVLFVAFGAPKQEEWLYKNIGKLKTVRLGIGVGGSFDFVAGEQVRAPKVFRDLGIEWLWRLFKQPKRFKRILNAVLVFPYLVLKKRI